MMSRRITGGLLIVAALMGSSGIIGCSSAPDPWAGKGEPRIVTSFPPLYCFARAVAGDKAAVINLCSNVGPHHYKYNPRDLVMMTRAQLLIANGLTLDDTFCDLLNSNSGNAKLSYLKLGKVMDDKNHDLLHTDSDEPKRIEAPKDAAGHSHAHGHAHAHGHEGHDHGDHDPHIWLGIPQAQKMVSYIRDELKAIDPANAATYDQNAAAYLQKLEQLLKDGNEELKDIKKEDRKLVTFHDSMQFFAGSFGLQITAVIEGGPGQSPSAERMKQLVEACKGIRVIAHEPQYEARSADTLQKELQEKHKQETKLTVLDPLETADPRDLETIDDKGNDWYLRKMRENLANLKKAWQ